MTASPFKSEYVTREEFNEMDLYMRDGFKTVIRYCDVIDAAVIRIEDKMIGLGVRVTALDSKATAIDGKVAFLSEEVAALGDKVTRLENRMEQSKEEILAAIRNK